ncbi:hypothetical protein GmHk_09G026590 [Glycine max]|nr:hypothetical protein GmHk_09G026590 [Glycine max]
MPWIFLLHHYNLFFLSLSENPNPGSSFAPLSLSATTGSGIKVLEWKDSMLGMSQISSSRGGLLAIKSGTSLDSL